MHVAHIYMYKYICTCKYTHIPHHTTVQQVLQGAAFGIGTGPIWLDDVMCSGLENQLFKCNSSAIGVHNCRHIEDAGVQCKGSISC